MMKEMWGVKVVIKQSNGSWEFISSHIFHSRSEARTYARILNEQTSKDVRRVPIRIRVTEIGRA